MAIRVTIFNEFVQEQTQPEILAHYPGGIHAHLSRALAHEDFTIRTATLRQDAEHGLCEAVLAETDVLMWWGHVAHAEVSDAVAQRVVERVHEGMGFLPMHSAHASKPFTRLMGTCCMLQWREANERARLWAVAPFHPIAQGIPLHFTLDHEEMYGEVFQVPPPEELIFVTWFQGGNIFRGGITYTRGAGRIFYFHPGHETLPSFHNPHVLRVLQNAIRWAKPAEPRDLGSNLLVDPLEPLS